MVRIFAKGFYGADLDRWGAFSFGKKGSRDRLINVLGDEDFALHYVTTTAHPRWNSMKGRATGLLRLERRPVATRDVVDLSWAEASEIDRWPFALPIYSGEAFKEPPLLRELLPRLKERNLLAVAAWNFVQLEPDEVDLVLSLPRYEWKDLYLANRT